MKAIEELSEEQVGAIGNYNPVKVTVSESIGTMALAAVALILLTALLKAQERIRELQEQLYAAKDD